eukprot:TRINITY_DN18183_c0_g1_i1.p1 TRINITY_DN18183_c0_g1~~TRINITY_DN18183_c0_g1_i1.p1  ORF type:complete len:100 (+),score=17.78 TRINITY_DN18183_c0_g1_i1:377-676(+)
MSNEVTFKCLTSLCCLVKKHYRRLNVNLHRSFMSSFDNGTSLMQSPIRSCSVLNSSGFIDFSPREKILERESRAPLLPCKRQYSSDDLGIAPSSERIDD